MTFIDKSQINSVSGGEPELLLPILEDFASSAETLISEAIGFTNSGQLAAVADRLHQLKGSSGTLGLTAFYQACKIAEAATLSGANPDLSSVNSLMMASVEEATAYMRPE